MVLAYQEEEVRREPLGVSRGWMEAETHHGRRSPLRFRSTSCPLTGSGPLGERHSPPSHRSAEQSWAGGLSGRKPHRTLLTLQAILIAVLTELLWRECRVSRGLSERDFSRTELIQRLIAFPATASRKAHRANKEHFHGTVRRI